MTATIRSQRSLFAFALLGAALLTGACASGGAPAAAPAPELPVVYVPGVVPDSFIVRLGTTQGDVDLMVRRVWSPLGADQLYEAFSTGFYDGARFFRSLRGFVVQFGIAADPAVTAAWATRRIADDSVTESNSRGTVVFAMGGPGTRTTQLFINLRSNARLDAMGFSPVGEVIRGMDAVDAFYTGYGDGGTPGSSPEQARITREGEAYLAASFPRLDKIETTKVIRAWFPAR
jgi:peptidyl-prolyl cis-trans isomerase A (cyclophilin A)